jgi:hypothetical protein
MAKQEFPEVDSEDVAWDAQLESWRDIFSAKAYPLFDVANVAALPAANVNDDGLLLITADDGATHTGPILAFSLSPTTNAWKKLAPQTAAVTTLVDNSGGAAANGTIDAVTDAATAAAAVKELATKLNELIVAMRLAGAMDD